MPECSFVPAPLKKGLKVIKKAYNIVLRYDRNKNYSSSYIKSHGSQNMTKTEQKLLFLKCFLK